MKLKRSLVGVAVALALGGPVGVAQATSPISLDYFTETATTLAAQWTVVSGAGSFSAVYDGTYWDVASVSGSLANPVTFLGGTLYLDVFDVVARHDEAPHAGENLLGPVYSTAALSQTLVQMSSTGNTAIASAMASHDGSTWVKPANWTTPHWDHFKLTATSNTNGSATILLQAVHPVPEPDSYAMMLAGIGLVGMIIRRRRSS